MADWTNLVNGKGAAFSFNTLTLLRIDAAYELISNGIAISSDNLLVINPTTLASAVC